MAEITDDEIALAAKVAAADQDIAQWTYDAECIAAFYRTLIVGEVPEDVAAPLTLNAQLNFYGADMGPCFADDEDD